MTLAEAMAPYEAHYRDVIITQTFGHLFPDHGYYQGKLRVAGDWSGMSVLGARVPGIGPSPWWTYAVEQFMLKQQDLPAGQVVEYDLGVMVRQVEEHRDTTGWTDEDWWDLNYDRPESERYRPPDPEVYSVIEISNLRSQTILEPL
jgi:hypothetical protein